MHYEDSKNSKSYFHFMANYFKYRLMKFNVKFLYSFLLLDVLESEKIVSGFYNWTACDIYDQELSANVRHYEDSKNSKSFIRFIANYFKHRLMKLKLKLLYSFLLLDVLESEKIVSGFYNQTACDIYDQELSTNVMDYEDSKNSKSYVHIIVKYYNIPTDEI